MVISLVLACLMASTLFLFLGERLKFRMGDRYINTIIIAIGLLIPVFLASSRNIIELGDTRLYGDILFNGARFADWSGYYNRFNRGYYAVEPLYLLITFLIGKITDNYHVLFFIVSAFNILLIYDGARKLKKFFSFEIWYAMCVFYLLYFDETLNITRQSLAVAVVFWAAHFIFEEKFWKYLLCIIVAMQIHITAALGLLMYILYIALMEKKVRKAIGITIIVIAVICVFKYDQVFLLFQNLNILPSKFYTLYAIDQEIFSPFAVLSKGPLVLFFGWKIIKSYKETNERDWLNWYLFLLLVIDLIISQLAGANADLIRISLYFAFMRLVMFASVKKKSERNLLLLYCFIYNFIEFWYYGVLPAGLFGGN